MELPQIHEISVPRETGCFYANAADLGLSRASSISQFCGPAEKALRNRQQKEHYLLASPNITGSRASRQRLDLGRDKESWAHLVHSQIQMFAKWSQSLLVRACDRQSRPGASSQSSHGGLGGVLNFSTFQSKDKYNINTLSGFLINVSSS